MSQPDVNGQYVNGQCLVAMPGLEGSFFEKTVIYMLDHNEEGAFGLIINKIMDITIDEVLEQINPAYHANLHPDFIYAGGPVDGHRGFVLHQPADTIKWEHQANVNAELAITNSADILEALANGENVMEYMIILGYSGWSPGQLEQEIADNSWINVNIPVKTLLDLPVEKRLDAALQTLGIQYTQLTQTAGHD